MSAKRLPINYLFPNLVTIISLCFGMSAIKYGLDARWELSVALLMIAAFLDAMDGRLARMLNASSKFGAELDSLADFINFGVAPALLLYVWSLHSFPIKGFGWASALTYSICCAFRLARYGASGDDKKNANYFFGVPAPAGAGLSLIPLMISFKLDILFFQQNPVALAGYLIVVAALMASQIPTISTKNIRFNQNLILPILFISTILIVILITEPWIALPVIGALYVLTIPMSVYSYYRGEHE